MQVLVVLIFTLTLVRGGRVPIVSSYEGPQYVPVLHNGVPVRKFSTGYEKSDHGCQPHHGLGCYSTNGDHPTSALVETSYYKPRPVYYKSFAHPRDPAPITETPEIYYPSKSPIQAAYQTSKDLPAFSHDGRPLDTPEVEEAKRLHFEEFAKALAATAPHQPEDPKYNEEARIHYRRRRSYTSMSVLNEHRVPIEPVEVQNARAAHLAAHQSPSHGYSTVQVHDPVYGVYYKPWTPKYDYYGHPLDVKEVEEAKEAHFRAYHEPAPVPEDTAEVAHAKFEHFAAHAFIKTPHNSL